MVDRKRVDFAVDITSVALISIAAVLSAVCGYQSGRWSGEASRFYSAANAARIESAEANERASALTAIDGMLFLQYIDAVAVHDARRAALIERSFPSEMRPAVAAWIATKPLKNASAPSSPFVMPQYRLAARVRAHVAEKAANASVERAHTATAHSDAFLLLTVIFATVSFLAAMSTKMVFPRHLIMIGLGCVGLIYGAVRLASLPFV
jgi:hypothetical protein